ncbi:MAG: hypothetical protein FWF87_08740 [Synergistaceae bacterium]|nr:hypothetical protein [Synergistaceae bacterium]
MKHYIFIAVLVLTVLAIACAAEAAGFNSIPPEAVELEAQLADTLVKNGRMNQNELSYSDTEEIEGEKCWAFNSPSGVYAVSVSGKMYIYVQVDYMPLEEFFEQTAALNKTLEEFLARTLTADVTGEDADIFNTPDAKGKNLFKLSKSKGSYVIVDKGPVKDGSDQYWYKVIYYYDDEILTGTYEDAYISGKFINIRNIAEDEKSALRFRLDRDY